MGKRIINAEERRVIMKKLSKNTLREISDYTAIVLGGLLAGIGFNWFIIPNHISPGGVSGVATIIHYLVPAIPVGLMIIAINIPLFLISWKELGRDFGIKSLVGDAGIVSGDRLYKYSRASGGPAAGRSIWRSYVWRRPGHSAAQ